MVYGMAPFSMILNNP